MWEVSTSFVVRATSVTATNKSSAITTATWILLVTFVLMFIIRETVKFTILRKFGADDVMIGISTILGIGLSVTTLMLASYGLGVLQRIITAPSTILMKAYYASDFLYISSLCFAKLSLVIYFHNIFFQRTHRRVVSRIGVLIGIWTVASLGAIAFQCQLPRPWEVMTLRCYDRSIFWMVYCIVDMTSDVAIVMLAVNLVAYLKIQFSRKVIVVACFAPRFLVVGASLVRLIYLYPVTPHDNPTFALWTPVICTQVQVCLAISTACIPYIKPCFAVSDGAADDVRLSRRPSKSMRYIYAFGAQPATSSWKKKIKELYCTDCAASEDLDYSCAGPSPSIPSPPPIGPLMSPQCPAPANPTALGIIPNDERPRAMRERGLALQNPNTQSSKAIGVNPQTASAHAPSSYVVSLLSPRSPPSSQVNPPIALPRSYDHLSATPSLGGGNGTANNDSHLAMKSKSPPQTPAFSLFPSPVTGRYAFVPQNFKPFVQKPVQEPVPDQQSSIERQDKVTAQPEYPERTSSLKQRNGQPGPAIKFAVGPNLTKIRPSTTIAPEIIIPELSFTGHSRVSTKPLFPFSSRSASGAAIMALDKRQSPQQARNKLILSPQNSSRVDHMSPVAPARMRNSWRNTVVHLGEARDGTPRPR